MSLWSASGDDKDDAPDETEDDASGDIRSGLKMFSSTTFDVDFSKCCRNFGPSSWNFTP
jgi:hypothetical protein